MEQAQVRLGAIFLSAGLALIHLFSGRLSFLTGVPRSHWLSVAGGISVSYVFVHVLPELAEGRIHFQELVRQRWLEEGIFLLALAGLVIFYGLERMAKQHRRSERMPTPGVFWIHIGSFATYNSLIGYILARQEYRTTTALLTFFVAMGTHFIVNDHGLRSDYKNRYDEVGRWVLAAAVLLGFAIGTVADFPRITYELFFAFLAGGVVLNVLKEELPRERESRFGAFAIGVCAYTALLLLI